MWAAWGRREDGVGVAREVHHGQIYSFSSSVSFITHEDGVGVAREVHRRQWLQNGHTYTHTHTHTHTRSSTQATDPEEGGLQYGRTEDSDKGLGRGALVGLGTRIKGLV